MASGEAVTFDLLGWLYASAAGGRMVRLRLTSVKWLLHTWSTIIFAFRPSHQLLNILQPTWSPSCLLAETKGWISAPYSPTMFSSSPLFSPWYVALSALNPRLESCHVSKTIRSQLAWFIAFIGQCIAEASSPSSSHPSVFTVI